jgi:hypothetical protein
MSRDLQAKSPRTTRAMYKTRRLALVTLCAVALTTGASRGSRHPALDLIYDALEYISSVCPSLGAGMSFLEISWDNSGNTYYGQGGSGVILMDGTYNYGANWDQFLADLVHEAWHAITDQDDNVDTNGFLVEMTDQFGRDGMHVNPYDEAWASGGCP